MDHQPNMENQTNMSLTLNHQRNNIIQEMKQEFTSFGYQEIYTPAFQPYDLYMQMNGTVNQQEMIKTIDNTGNVLVLRPDVTIPLTQQIATTHLQLKEKLRYFYILDVFRQAKGNVDNQENTQIGAEYFGNVSAAADAEMIALSLNVLHSICLKNITIELGHAGFFKELIAETNLNEEEMIELKQSIQAKNVPGIEALLQETNIEPHLKDMITSLPFLYGKPEEVMQKAHALPLTDNMRKTLDNMMEIYDYLEAYGMKDHIVADLSLINHMDYYSDIIFQGFIEKVGKPVLMGGRYNTLANHFNANIPAVGFACNLDLLLEYADTSENDSNALIDIGIYHDPEMAKENISLASQLRAIGYRTMMYETDSEESHFMHANINIYTDNGIFKVTKHNQTLEFTTKASLITFLEKETSS